MQTPMTSTSGETSWWRSVRGSSGYRPSPTRVEPHREVLTMNQPILVTGGSGTLGRGVVDRLLAGGHQVRVLSRRPRPAGTPTAVGW
jgi:hypothetical protein